MLVLRTRCCLLRQSAVVRHYRSADHVRDGRERPLSALGPYGRDELTGSDERQWNVATDKQLASVRAKGDSHIL